MGIANTVSRYIRGIDRRTVVGAATLYFVALFLSVFPPFFDVVNRAEPYIFDLPFVLFWLLFVSVMMAIGLAVLYWVESTRGEVV